jgi:hypothetical protein
LTYRTRKKKRGNDNESKDGAEASRWLKIAIQYPRDPGRDYAEDVREQRARLTNYTKKTRMIELNEFNHA